MKRCVGALAVTALLAAPSVVAGQDAAWNRYTLEGLDGVFVRIEANDVCEEANVRASDFEAATSLQLIEAEVGVLTLAEMLERPALPELRVSLECATGAGGMVAYTVGLRLQQAAQMLRDTQITLPEAVTWYAAKLGVVSAADAPAALSAALDEKLTQFAEAWAEVNTEEGSR